MTAGPTSSAIAHPIKSPSSVPIESQTVPAAPRSGPGARTAAHVTVTADVAHSLWPSTFWAIRSALPGRVLAASPPFEARVRARPPRRAGDSRREGRAPGRLRLVGTARDLAGERAALLGRVVPAAHAALARLLLSVSLLAVGEGVDDDSDAEGAGRRGEHPPDLEALLAEAHRCTSSSSAASAAAASPRDGGEETRWPRAARLDPALPGTGASVVESMVMDAVLARQHGPPGAAIFIRDPVPAGPPGPSAAARGRAGGFWPR